MRPLLIVLSIFVGIPLFELYLLIQVGTEIGALNTVGFTLLTAFIGGYLVRLQGLATAMRVNETVGRGEVPALEMIEGALLLVSGLFLLLPGFVTDALGFLLLIPPLRRLLVVSQLRRGGVIRQANPTREDEGVQQVIEGEYEEVRSRRE